ncbi:MAG: hypothetical protein JKY43_03405 [Phycisphaerales bacterium]|nr:hypothetical protein [Phycisphaerales bacterium]
MKNRTRLTNPITPITFTDDSASPSRCPLIDQPVALHSTNTLPSFTTQESIYDRRTQRHCSIR